MAAEAEVTFVQGAPACVMEIDDENKNNFAHTEISQLFTRLREHGWVAVPQFGEVSGLAEANGMIGRLAVKLSEATNKSKTEVSELKVRKSSRYIANTEGEMSLHTDNVYLPEPCKLVAMYCVQQASYGGESMLLDSYKVISDIPEGLARHLRTPVWGWGMPKSDSQMLERHPVLVGKSIRWWRQGLRVSDYMMDIANEFDSLLHSSEHIEELLLKPGDLIVIDNSRVLHGRRAFEEDDGRRRLIRARIW